MKNNRDLVMCPFAGVVGKCGCRKPVCRPNSEGKIGYILPSQLTEVASQFPNPLVKCLEDILWVASGGGTFKGDRLAWIRDYAERYLTVMKEGEK